VVSQDGSLVGGSRSNVFIVKDNHLRTPSLASGAFDGVTRRVVMKIIQDLDLAVKEEIMTVEDSTTCTEVFLTSTLREVMPLVECEDKPVGDGTPGGITSRILAAYRKSISG